MYSTSKRRHDTLHDDHGAEYRSIKSAQIKVVAVQGNREP